MIFHGVIALLWIEDNRAAPPIRSAQSVARMNTQTELDTLRVKRDGQAAALRALYAWGYHNAVWPSYEDWKGGELSGTVIRGNLFPGGSPSHAGRSRQWLHSAVGMSAYTKLALESQGKGERLSSLIPVASDPRSRDAEEETPPKPEIDEVDEAEEPSVIDFVPLAEEDVAAK